MSDEAPPRVQRATLGAASVQVVVTAAGLDVDGRLVSWLDVDDVVEGDHRVRLDLADGSALALTGLGATHDDFLTDLRRARRRARLPALTVATGDPLVSFASRAPAGVVDVHLFPKALVLEPRQGPLVSVPLSLIDAVVRDGYRVTVRARGLTDVELRALGAQTDEFVMRLAAARRDLQGAVCAAYASFEPTLEGYVAPDGWAQSRVEAGAYWGVLDAAVRAGERGEFVAVLAGLAGDALRIGLYTDGGTGCMPFVLAVAGSRVAVESADDEARATFVFAVDDLAQFNATLLLTSFRREALYLPDDQLGRWAVAVRTFPAVAAARRALVARVVHDVTWEQKVRAALGG